MTTSKELLLPYDVTPNSAYPPYSVVNEFVDALPGILFDARVREGTFITKSVVYHYSHSDSLDDPINHVIDLAGRLHAHEPKENLSSMLDSLNKSFAKFVEPIEA
jgi:hypothetical protein